MREYRCHKVKEPFTIEFYGEPVARPGDWFLERYYPDWGLYLPYMVTDTFKEMYDYFYPEG